MITQTATFPDYVRFSKESRPNGGWYFYSPIYGGWLSWPRERNREFEAWSRAVDYGREFLK